MSIPRLRSHCIFGLRALAFLALVPLATACGGGGGSTPAADDGTTPPGDTTDLVDVSPLSVDAAVNTTCTIAGGTFEAPVTCTMLDASGAPIGPARAGTVSPDGRVVEMETPILPDLASDVDVVLEVRDGAGR
nr:hypothetical protein [Planctomycetota bacterium]